MLFYLVKQQNPNQKPDVMKPYNYSLLAFLIIFSSCSLVPEVESVTAEDINLLDIEQLDIPIGFEFDTKIRLAKFLDLLFNYGAVTSTITEASSTGGADGTARDLTEFIGKNTSFVPQNNFNVGLASTIPVSDNATLDISVNLNGTGKIYWEDSNSPDFTSDAYQLLDAQIGLTMNKFKVSLWGRNILNEQYYLEYLDYGVGWRGTPATVGATVSVTF